MMKVYYASNNHNQHDCNMMETGFVLAYVLWVSRVRCHPHAFHGRGMLPRSLTYPLLVFQLVWCVNLLLHAELHLNIDHARQLKPRQHSP